MTRTLLGLAVSAALAPAWANPTGPSTVSGATLISNPSASVLQVVNTPGAIIHWQGFSIAVGETTRFVQQNAASAVLNRVTGANPSSILGRLESNGRVFLINPNGIVFGGSSVVDVAGLIASTRDISNADFLAGNYRFSGAGNGAITVQSGAQILTTTYGPGGQVWLFAKNVTQEAGSTITTPQGQVVLAAGDQMQVGATQLGQMSFTVVTDGTSTVDSLGAIAADRGAVGLFADFVNHRGSINAGTGGSVDMNASADLRIKDGSSIQAADGSITLRGGRELEVEYDAVINADGANGRISFESNNLLVYPSGNIHAVGGEVTFLQYQPSTYVPGSQQYPWTTPNGFSDENPIVFRGSDGSVVVRFQRRDDSTGDAVGVFEVVLNGRTGALLSGPVALPAGSAAASAYNAARRAPQNASNTYNAAYDAAQTAYNTALAALTASEQTGFDEATKTAADQIDAALNSNGGLRATVDGLIAGRINNIDALRADAAANPSRYAYPFTLEFQITQSLNFYRGQMFDAIRLAVYDSRLASANVRPGMEGSVGTVTQYSNDLAQVRSAYFAGVDQAQTTLATAVAAAQSALTAVTSAAPDQILATRAAYNSALVSGVSTFLSDNDADLRGVPTTVRIPTADGGAALALRLADRVVMENGEEGPISFTEYGGRGAGTEIRTSAGSLRATVGSGNVVPMLDGTYLVNQGGGYDVYKLDGTYVKSDSQNYAGILFPMRTGGFMAITANGEQVIYAKDVPAYTRVNNLTGAAGPVAAVLSRPGEVPDGSAGLPPAPPQTAPVVSGNPNGGSDFGGVAGCNSAVCASEVRGAITQVDAIRASQNAVKDGRIEDKGAAEAVAALEKAQQAGRSSADIEREGQAVMRENADTERLIAETTEAMKTMPPEEAAKQKEILDGILKDRMEREQIYQQLGLDRNDPNAQAVVAAIQNMSEEERVAFGNAFREKQARGQ